MAKFKRFDPSNKKQNKHKQKMKEASQHKKIKSVGVKRRKYYETEDI